MKNISTIQKCPKCKQAKRSENFSRTKNFSKINMLCIECFSAEEHVEKLKRKAAYLKNTHNMTLRQYEARLYSQGGCCAICQDHLPANGVDSEDLMILRVDHCHKTGRFRGLLCNNCNIGLGSFKDNEASLLNAIFYLRKAQNSILRQKGKESNINDNAESKS